MHHTGTLPIDTSRLLLRPFIAEDAEDLFNNWASDPQVTRFLTWPCHESLDTSRRIIAEWMDGYSDPSFYQWAIQLKPAGPVIGSISVVKLQDATGTVEIGYCLGRPWWGKGLMTEALDAVIRTCFEDLEVDCVRATHDPANLASGRVMQKCGMSYEGRLRHAVVIDHVARDQVVYSILKDEFEERRAIEGCSRWSGSSDPLVTGQTGTQLVEGQLTDTTSLSSTDQSTDAVPSLASTQIRVAGLDDAASIHAIYADYVRHTAITFECTVPTVDEFRRRIKAILERYPFLVACQGDEILGYASAKPFVGREAYQWSAETTIYLKMGIERRGLGRRLYHALESVCRAQGITNLCACIGQPKVEDEYLTYNSIGFHSRLGYRMVGGFDRCGHKFGRWYDMVWMEKVIGPHLPEPRPILPFPELPDAILREAGIDARLDVE